MVPVYILLAYYLFCALAADGFAVLLTLPMMAIVAANLAITRRPNLGLWEMTWFCAYLFFAIGPLQAVQDYQFAEGSPVVGFTFTEAELVSAMAIPVLFFLALTPFSIRRFRARGRGPDYSFSYDVIALLLVLNVIGFVGNVVAAGGLTNLLATRYDKEDMGSAFLAVPMMGLQVVTFLIILLHWSRNKADIVSGSMLLVATVLMLIFENPYNSPRYFLLASYLPALLIVLRGQIGHSRFLGVAIGSLVFVMPILNITSRMGGTIATAIDELQFKDFVYRLPFIDVFDTLAYMIVYLDKADFYFGSKTLGIVLFFVPRAIWESKPTLLGLDVGKELLDRKMAGTDNLSFFIGGDFYADLGYLGVVAGACLVGALLRRATVTKQPLIFGQDLQSYILLSSMPILMRGPVAANAALVTTLVGATWLSLFLGQRSAAERQVAPNQRVMARQPGLPTGGTRPRLP